MRRLNSLSILIPILIPILLAAQVGCTDDTDPVDSGIPADTGVVDTGVEPDTGVPADTGIPDTGPLPCIRDQGGADNRGCDPGMVCNLAMDPPECVPGKSCGSDAECNPCSDFIDPEACGHGYHLVAFCDANHGNVCTRSRAACEICETDTDCGRRHPNFGGQNSCLDYGGGEKYCGMPCTPVGCPRGFACDADGLCRRTAGCEPDPIICPTDDALAGPCTQTAPAQICPTIECPDTGGALCSTNSEPGALGICIGFCTEDADCPADKPTCNRRNGICIPGCTKGSCSEGQVCHMDGFCAPPCPDDAYCEGDSRYGPESYCNIVGRPPPRYYKGGMTGYRDDNSCAPLGCEQNVDCGQSGIVCDKVQAPPTCVPGCYERDDCLAAEVCRRGAQQQYTEQECRMLPEKDEGDAELGVCCDPGCTDLNLDCGFNQWCCGERASPYEETGLCLSPTATVARQALPGECFDMATDPWCQVCTTPGQIGGDCDSGWLPGFNVDPDINGGVAFQEEEICIPISDSAAVCSITCNPTVTGSGVNTCPRLWQCTPITLGCFQDADCNGLTCVGADPPNNIQGRCQCGENGMATATCPQNGFAFPRCVELGQNGEMFCLGTYNCLPPALQVDMMTGETNYPEACGF